MEPDLIGLYRQMLFSRRFEESVTELWRAGRISGEMHLGTGEEGIVAGVADHLRDGDALALDHRATPPLLMRGVDPTLILKELLGHTDGLCRGRGGHMHLFSPPHLAASSGIVGAAAPAAVGFALSATYLRPGAVAVAFFGEGAMNEGQVMESLNLAAAWQLPVIFVCKDNAQAIATPSPEVTGGRLDARARSLGLATLSVDGSDVVAVWHAARTCFERARAGRGPSFLHASCIHLEGHFLGDPLVRVARRPLREMLPIAIPMLRSALKRGGAPLGVRIRSMLSILKLVLGAHREITSTERDPVKRTRDALIADPDAVSAVEEGVTARIQEILIAVGHPLAATSQGGSG